MNYQEYMIDATKKAAAEAFRYAKAVPADKLEWKPTDDNRAILDLTRELAMCPIWAVQIIGSDTPPDWSEEAQAAQKAEMEKMKTVAECEAQCNSNLDKLSELFGTITDEQLKNTKWLPFDGGRDFTVAEMMDYPRWNFNYHTGQFAYVQMMLGDKEMH